MWSWRKFLRGGQESWPPAPAQTAEPTCCRPPSRSRPLIFLFWHTHLRSLSHPVENQPQAINLATATCDASSLPPPRVTQHLHLMYSPPLQLAPHSHSKIQAFTDLLKLCPESAARHRLKCMHPESPDFKLIPSFSRLISVKCTFPWFMSLLISVRCQKHLDQEN